MSKAPVTALVHVGPAEEDEAIYCEAKELAPGQRPGQQDAFTSQRQAFKNQQRAFQQQQGQGLGDFLGVNWNGPLTDAFASLGNCFGGFGIFGGFF